MTSAALIMLRSMVRLHLAPLMLLVLRRAAVTLGLAGLVAVFGRRRVQNRTRPPQHGWRELSGPDLR